jgi:hypothetical protein
MSYEHILVSDINQEELNAHVTISPEAYNFAQLVADTLNAKCAKRDYKSLYIYRDNEPYVMGWVGYGNFRKSGNEYQYNVSSRLIRNGKYNEYSKEHHYSMSKNVDVALRNAKRYLRTYNVLDRAKVVHVGAYNAFYTIKEDAQKELRESRYELFKNHDSFNVGSSKLVTEFRSILSSDYQFTNPEVRDQIELFLKSADKNYRVNNDKVETLFVSVINKRGVQYYETAPLSNFNYHNTDYGDPMTYTDDTLPSELASKLSILSMLDKGQFVEGVGYRANDSMFHIHIQDEE